MIAQFAAAKEHLMQKIAVASAVMIFLSLITAQAKGCPNGHVSGHCAVAHHQVKHAKHSNMGGAFIGAYHR
jgi:hypothetical protein